jgi:hypothetical protein
MPQPAPLRQSDAQAGEVLPSLRPPINAPLTPYWISM